MISIGPGFRALGVGVLDLGLGRFICDCLAQGVSKGPSRSLGGSTC